MSSLLAPFCQLACIRNLKRLAISVGGQVGFFLIIGFRVSESMFLILVFEGNLPYPLLVITFDMSNWFQLFLLGSYTDHISHFKLNSNESRKDFNFPQPT